MSASRKMSYAVLALLVLAGGAAAATDAGKTAPKLTGPFTHGNLTVFLVHGPDQLKGRNILTLQEALEQKKVIVYETKNVNQLAIENVSESDDVFAQAGDIVKGGQQDRTIAVDMILAPKSGKVPLSSFCVEAGRWQKRGQEASDRFSSSAGQLATKDLKIANRSGKGQGEVWKQVAQTQGKLSKNLMTEVKSAQSASSLQLTLENKKLQEAIESHIKNLAAIVDKEPTAVGFIFAINGQINSADVYASPALFRKLWPKLIKATAIEAVAEMKKDVKFAAVSAEACAVFMTESAKGKAKDVDISARVRTTTRENAKCYEYDTRDKKNPDVSLRRNLLAK